MQIVLARLNFGVYSRFPVYGTAYITEMKNFGEALQHILTLGITTPLIHMLIHV